MARNSTIAGIVLCLSLSAATARADDVAIIDDVKSWRHPTKDVLARHKIILKKVELHDNRKFPIFFVAFPWDPRTSPNAAPLRKLEQDLLSANGWRDYALDVESDNLRITITWRRDTRVMDETFSTPK